MSKYHPDLPTQCPPKAADPADGVVYRVSKQSDVQNDPLLSWCEANDPRGDPEKCQHWGLSVWRSEAAANHARSVIPAFRKQYVVALELNKDCGCLMATPSGRQPEHWTWWKALGAAIKDFKVVSGPEK